MRKTYHTGLEWWLDLLPNQQIKVQVLCEERMSLDLVCAVHAQPLRRIARQQPAQDALSRGADALSEHQGVLEDLLVHVVGVLVIVRRETGQHLVKQDAQGPPVDNLAVTFAVEDLGC